MSAAPQPTAVPFELPHRFGRSYLLFDRVGQGGMAEIFLARGKTQVGATRLAVVKLVLPLLASDGKFAAMLVAEAKLAAQLSHANIVQTYDLGREDGRLYIAMEYVEGFDLNELLRRCARERVPLPSEFALFIVSETLRALDYAHRRKDPDGKPLGIVHRDVSPSNVLISFEGEVKLCDFGIARAVTGATDLAAEAIEGKAAYMSPEHARGEAIDGRSDVFAASIILWEMLAGRRLYKSAPDKDALTMAREGAVPPLPDRGLPDHARIAGIVAKGLAPAPADRYPTALAMLRELDGYVMDNRLIASPLRLGSFLVDNFGTDIVESRRARERAASAIEQASPGHGILTSFPPPPPRAGEDESVAPTAPRPAFDVSPRSGPAPVVIARTRAMPPPPEPRGESASDEITVPEARMPGPAPTGFALVTESTAPDAPVPSPERSMTAVERASSHAPPRSPAAAAAKSAGVRGRIYVGAAALAAAAATVAWFLARH